MKIAQVLSIILVFSAFTVPVYCQYQPAAKEPPDPTKWEYNSKSIARAFGNVGGWWSFTNENEKEAFLDGYRAAMDSANRGNNSLCKVLQQTVKPTVNQEAYTAQMSMALFVCSTVHESANYEKVTVKDLDDFYGNPVNQPIPLDWTMAYLRDKASGAKTEGQLLDTLKTEQKDIHDCNKYSHLCKLGLSDTAESNK